jgi:hypothetical protein
MTRKATTVVILMLAFVFSRGIGSAFAQESTPSAKPAAQDNPSPVEAYRLDFSVNEMEDGKKINTRQYSMNLNGNDGNDIKIGTRVPVQTSQEQYQYIDVGTSIFGRLQARDGQLRLEVRAEISNFAIPDQAQGHDSRPLIRQLKINASTIALLGKPMVVGSVDDPNSKRQFQLEVTVTKLR